MTFSKLGTDTDTGQIVELSQASRRQGLYIIGANGTGKTGLIEHLILQDIDQGLGVGLLDPHGDLTNAILAKMTKREDDVILLDIQDEDHPFGLNIFECSNPQSPTAVQKIVDLVMHIFEKLYDVNRQTPRMAQFLRNCTHTLVANPGYTMADIPLLLQDQECRSKLVAQVKDPQVRLFWQTYNALKPSEQFDRAESTINKMDELLQPLPRNIVGQAQTTVNMQQVMDERKILLVKLSAQLDQVTSLVGTLIIALFLNAAYSRANIPINKRKQFNLYADEFQRFATEDFATLLTEARKFGIATTIAHQARYQPGMTDGIRAVSLQAANFVVFRVTSPDADELAGGFDITPQAAWEEEIAKEWVEVLKPEWYERVEEEVIDGTEPIETPVTDVTGWLVTKGKHKNHLVNAFTTEFLVELHQLKKYPDYFEEYTDINNLFQRAMEGDFITPPRVETFCHLAHWRRDAYAYNLGALGEYDDSRHYKHEATEKAKAAFTTLWTAPLGSNAWYQADAILMDEARKVVRQTKLRGELSAEIADIQIAWYKQFKECIEKIYEQVKFTSDYLLNHYSSALRSYSFPADRSPVEFIQNYYQFVYRQEKAREWSHVILTQIEWVRVPHENFDLVQGIYDHFGLADYMVAPGQNEKFYHEADLARAVEPVLQHQRAIFLKLLADFKQVMQALANDPIKENSGLVQPRKRKQINYHTHPPQTLTHPRKTIMHPQRTYQDVQKDIANQLSGLRNFTARVKLGENAPQNPGKKCGHCGKQSNSGAKFCTKCGKQLPAPNEYTLTTLKPLGGIGKAALQQRLTTIQGNNIKKGYVRDRTTVEVEIIKRQTSCSGSAPAPPQKPQPQPQYARQVPVQGHCPKCNATNPRGSKFCNQCGTKL